MLKGLTSYSCQVLSLLPLEVAAVLIGTVSQACLFMNATYMQGMALMPPGKQFTLMISGWGGVNNWDFNNCREFSRERTS